MSSRSSRFAVAVHVLVTLRQYGDRLISSELLAGSVGTNPVVVRRVISNLRQAKLVTSQAGVCGGTMLAVDAGEITLLDVYRAVDGGEVFRIHEPNPKCPIGACMPTLLQQVLDDAQSAMEERLSSATIDDVYADMRATGCTVATPPGASASPPASASD